MSGDHETVVDRVKQLPRDLDVVRIGRERVERRVDGAFERILDRDQGPIHRTGLDCEDGRVDALVVDAEGRPLLLHNESSVASWTGFRVRQDGPGRARNGYGTIITVETKGRRLVRQCQPGGSYLSSSDPRVHFGLGGPGVNTLDQVTVRWPDGKQETWKNVPANRYLTLTRGKTPV